MMKDIEVLAEIDYPKMLSMDVNLLPIRFFTTSRRSLKSQITSTTSSSPCSRNWGKLSKYLICNTGKSKQLGSWINKRRKRTHQSNYSQLKVQTEPLHAIESWFKDEKSNFVKSLGNFGGVIGILKKGNRRSFGHIRRKILIFEAGKKHVLSLFYHFLAKLFILILKFIN